MPTAVRAERRDKEDTEEYDEAHSKGCPRRFCSENQKQGNHARTAKSAVLLHTRMWRVVLQTSPWHVLRHALA
jgi:hypothetical protein